MASFTTTCPGIADCLRNEVGVKDPASLNDKKFIAYLSDICSPGVTRA